MTIRGHFDGKRIVLDEPMPPGVPANTPVSITLENGASTGAHDAPDKRDLFDKILGLAGEDDLSADYAAQHEHYTKGTPKR